MKSRILYPLQRSGTRGERSNQVSDELTVDWKSCTMYIHNIYSYIYISPAAISFLKAPRFPIWGKEISWEVFSPINLDSRPHGSWKDQILPGPKSPQPRGRHMTNEPNRFFPWAFETWERCKQTAAVLNTRSFPERLTLQAMSRPCSPISYSFWAHHQHHQILCTNKYSLASIGQSFC